MRKTFSDRVFNEARRRLSDRMIDDAVTFVVGSSLFVFGYVFFGLFLYQLAKAANRMP